jgi:glycosyltransferase involved in cell wall biosynthesis
MAQHGQFSDQVPLLSIIVPVYNDWAMLDACLQSLTHETGIPFEVIIVDDGSKEAAPEYIRRWTECYPLSSSRITLGSQLPEIKGFAARRVRC